MSEKCPHVGKEHPIHFHCGNCEDTADDCNCNFCGVVFCDLCQDMISADCDEIVEAWRKEHPKLSVRSEAIRIRQTMAKPQ